jgi:hypothetical protein
MGCAFQLPVSLGWTHFFLLPDLLRDARNIHTRFSPLATGIRIGRALSQLTG